MPRPESSRVSIFATNVFKLVTGTTLAQAIAVLASSLLTRLSEAFGFLRALHPDHQRPRGRCLHAACELAIMLPQEDHEAANLLALSLPSAARFSSPSSGRRASHPTSSWFLRMSSSAESSSR